MTKEFEEKVKEIYDLLHGYGLRKTGVQIESFEDMQTLLANPESKALFYKYVHEGFRKGHILIVDGIIEIEKSRAELKSNLKDFRRDRNKDEAQKVNHELKKLKYNESILRNLADSLAWTLMDSQYWVARRYHSGSKNRPSLLNSNIESLHFVAEEYYKEHPDGFVLYCDVTSFIDITDIICVSEKMEIKSVEVKEGSKAKEVFDFIDKIAEAEDFKPEEMGLEGIENPKKFFDQVDRTLKQITKGNRLSKLLKEEQGPDPFTGQPTYIGEIDKPLIHYHEILYEMFQRLEEKAWAYEVVENVLCIGMYRDEFIGYSDQIFKHTVKTTKFEEDFPIIPFNQQLFLPICEPIFQNPLGIDKVMDIIFGRVRILIAVDINSLIDFFNLLGMKARWLSRKETQKHKEESPKRQRPFEYKNRAVGIKGDGDVELILGDSFLGRLVFDSLYPSSPIEMYKQMSYDKLKGEN